MAPFTSFDRSCPLFHVPRQLLLRVIRCGLSNLKTNYSNIHHFLTCVDTLRFFIINFALYLLWVYTLNDSCIYMWLIWSEWSLSHIVTVATFPFSCFNQFCFCIVCVAMRVPHVESVSLTRCAFSFISNDALLHTMRRSERTAESEDSPANERHRIVDFWTH